MEIIYVDNHILVVNKPAGMATQASGLENISLEELAKEWIKKEFKKPGNVFLEPIHRLDRVVSGLVLFARTTKALSRLQAEMRAQRISKTYVAEVEGVLGQKEATLEHFLAHGDHKAYLSATEGKRAVLHYSAVKEEKDRTLLKVILETGRYHQIRLQLSAIGHPIIGDSKYGSTRPYEREGIALMHTELKFIHPVTKEKQRFTLQRK